MDPASVVMLVLYLVQKNAATFKEINKGDLPQDALSSFSAWVSDNNIPIDDPDTGATFYEINLGNLGFAYVADISGDDPDMFRATAIIEKGNVIGENVQSAD